MTDAIKLAIEALQNTIDCLMRENEKNDGPICDTIWYDDHTTLFDYINCELATLRAQPAGWIAVTERLPKPWDAVMVHPRPNDYVNEAYLNHKGVWMYSEYVSNFGDQAYPCAVTHWMPLPPPPGQEQPAQPDHSELVKKLQDLVDHGWIEGCKTTTRDIEDAILALT
jgi:hypothetical protein